MPGTIDQNNQQSNSQNDNFASGGSVNGYASPYSASDQQPQTQSAPAPVSAQAASPVTQQQSTDQKPAPTTAAPEERTPDIQDFLSGNIPEPSVPNPTPAISEPADKPKPIVPAVSSMDPMQSKPASDNLLDHPEKVDEILKKGDTTNPMPVSQPPFQPASPVANQTPVTPSSSNSNSTTPQTSPIAPVTPTPAVKPSVDLTPKTTTVQAPAAVVTTTTTTVEPVKKDGNSTLPTVQTVKTQQSPSQNQSFPQQRKSSGLNPEEDLKVLTPRNVDGSTINVNKYENISELLDLVIQKNGSDVHLTVNYPPFIRVDDKLIPVGGVLNKDDVKKLISQTLSGNQKELLEVNREVDLSYQHKDKGRFRINAYYERGNLAAAYRLIPQKIRSITELNLPGILLDITKYSQGLFLVTGPTGSGKSTSLAAMIQHINESAPKHIITIEDPIEYVYPKAMSLVDQRELGGDTHDWSIALKSALRQDPDVLLIGEMRDFDTIQSAITLAETGHLVFATLHTNSAAQSIDRIIDVFPPHQQEQIKTQLAGSLKGILSQRLVPLIGGGRQAVIELLLVTPAVQNLIREGKTYQLDNVIATGVDLGMLSMEKSLVKLVREGKITTATAQEYAIRPEEVLKLMKGGA